jgi:hypothetical protein
MIGFEVRSFSNHLLDKCNNGYEVRGLSSHLLDKSYNDSQAMMSVVVFVVEGFCSLNETLFSCRSCGKIQVMPTLFRQDHHLTQLTRKGRTIKISL